MNHEQEFDSYKMNSKSTRYHQTSVRDRKEVV